MTNETKGPSMKLARPKRGPNTSVAARMEAISGGDTATKNGPGLAKLPTVSKTYRLTPRALNLITLAANADKAEGKRASMTSKLEDAIIATYAHLERES